MTSSPTPHDQGAFRTTRWTRVCQAKDDSQQGRRALAELCEAYYEPVLAYLRGALRDADQARETTHAFFAKLLAGGAMSAADPERGRFRFYLLGAVKHFLAHQREAEMRLKRGGGVLTLSRDAEQLDSSASAILTDPQLSPEAAYDRQWAVTVLERAVRALQAECVAQGKEALFAHLRPSLLGEAAYGEQTLAAESLGLSAAALKVAAHRLRHRFRQQVKAEIAGTLRDRAAVEDEMGSLFAALGG